MNRLSLIAAACALLAVSCAPRQKTAWDAFPLSDGIDKAQLASQMAADPADWKAAAEFLQREDLAQLPEGRYDLTESGVYANIQSYTTKESSKYEAHKKYIDVQVVQSGHEYIYVSTLDALSERLQDYDEAADIEFFAKAASARPLVADASHWVILFPSDAHMPCITADSPSAVRKVVVKIPYSR